MTTIKKNLPEGWIELSTSDGDAWVVKIDDIREIEQQGENLLVWLRHSNGVVQSSLSTLYALMNERTITALLAEKTPRA